VLRARSLLVIIGAALGCGDSGPSTAPGAPPSEAAGATCPGGLRATGESCEPVFAQSCPPNAMATFGSGECAPVGIAACADGWQRDETGHGCEPILPTKACSGGTRAAIGKAECVPIGDCAAPFPPPDATIIVDGTTAPNHYATLSEAVDAAPAGATIAIGAVTLRENVFVEKPLTLVGKCPAETVLDQGAPSRYAALSLSATGKVEVRNLSIRNRLAGAMEIVAGELALRDVVISDNAGFGLHAAYGSHASLENVLIANTKRRGPKLYGAGLTVEIGSTVTLRDATISHTEGPGLAVTGKKSVLEAGRVLVQGSVEIPGSDEGITAGVLVRSSARGVLRESFVRDVDGMGISAANLATLEVERSRVGDIHASSDQNGASIYVVEESQAHIKTSTIADVELIGAYADGKGATIAVEDSVVYGPTDAKRAVIGRGVVASVEAKATVTGTLLTRLHSAAVSFDGGQGRVERSLIKDIRAIGWPNPKILWGGWGVIVQEGGSATIDRVTIEEATLSGLTAGHQATLDGTNVLVRGTRVLDYAGTGSCVQTGMDSHLTLTGAAMLGCTGTSVIVGRASTLALRGAVIADTTDTGEFAHGITVHAVSVAELDDVYIARNPGIGLAANGAGATMRRGGLLYNGVAVHAQAGSFVRESADDSALSPGELRVSPTTKVLGNAQRIGSGVVPMPGGDE
jgi:hypothetical protein